MIPLLFAYYIIGLEYSYQKYKRLERLDDIFGNEVLFASFILPMLWLYHLVQKLTKREKRFYKTYKLNK